jgi:hypothetical protein
VAQSFRHGGEVVQFFRTAKAIQEVGVRKLPVLLLQSSLVLPARILIDFALFE